jgi:HK97 gp10 family phage protein
MQAILPRVVTAIETGTNAVLQASQEIVPVDTGALKASGNTEVTIEGQKVIGAVVYNAPYAAYVEFGTGRRGASSSGAGPYSYDPNWPGMVAQPYMRPALDTARPQILAAFAEAGFTI